MNRQNNGILDCRFRPLFVPRKDRYHSLASDWARRVISNGGAAVAMQTLAAVSDFCREVDAQGLVGLMRVVNVVAPDSLTAALTPLVQGTGLSPWTNYNFVSGDLSVHGLLGNATNKQVNTGWVPRTSGWTNTNGGVTIYAATTSAGNECDTGATSVGGTWSTDEIYCSTNNSGSTLSDLFNNATGYGRIVVAGAGTGYHSFNRVSSTTYRIFRAHSGLAHGQIGLSTGSMVANPPNLALSAWGGWYQSVGAINYPTGKRLSFVAFHDGLTIGQSAAFYAAVQKMRTAMGGGFV